MRLDGERALAWRLARHALEPAAASSVADVARRVVALRGWPADLADRAVQVRLADPQPKALERALETGEVIRSYAFRGGSYVFTPEIAATYLAVRAGTGIWAKPRYQAQGRFALEDWEPLRAAVRERLAVGPATRAEIAEHVLSNPTLRHLAEGLTGFGSDSLYKPLHWWGDICFGPERDGQSTFRWLADDPAWPGLPDVADAGPRAVALYLGAYGPVTDRNLSYWLTEGLGVPRRELHGWIEDLGEGVTKVKVDDDDALVLTEHVEEIAQTSPSDTVHLLPGYDPWVMGPGTADARIVPPEHR
ncbi:MAG: winged helix DNA-binding domain-containing protein, partial [Actinomycetales bacterium]|nr:winged helix DNA-binding domain-containing protein [Actinomycetales bacterium]